MAVLVQTSLGEITIDMFVDEVPTLCANFLKLCKLKKYNNSLFHSVEKNFIARSGLLWHPNPHQADADCKAPSEFDKSILAIIKDENPSGFHRIVSDDKRTKDNDNQVFSVGCCDSSSGQLREHFHPKLRHNRRGVVGMANAKSGQVGSSFYITLRDSIDYLDDKRSIIGIVTEGSDVLDKLNEVIVEDRISNKPLQPVRILHTIILDDPFPDPYGMAEAPPSPVTIEDEAMKAKYTIEEEIDALERIAKSEAKSRAIALEVLGDLPDAEIAPPDNVLFVCKLNPLTESKDLELIFSRFGRILSCEIIRDWKTGDSLQYGFIEFEDRDACVNALFKMDGCLIDDRRIHVDFCQSVGKQWNEYKRYGVHSTSGKLDLQSASGETETHKHRQQQEKKQQRQQQSIPSSTLHGFVFKDDKKNSSRTFSNDDCRNESNSVKPNNNLTRPKFPHTHQSIHDLRIERRKEVGREYDEMRQSNSNSRSRRRSRSPPCKRKHRF